MWKTLPRWKGKNHGHQPANLHYIGWGHKRRGFTTFLIPRRCHKVYIGRKTPTPSSISNTKLIDGVVPLNANGPLRFGPSLNLDHSSTYMWVEMLKTKDQALEYFRKIKLRVELESDGKLKAFRTDWGGQFTSNMFSVFCSEGGIKHFTTTPYSPQQNGVVERRNQTVIEMARCMLKSMNVPS